MTLEEIKELKQHNLQQLNQLSTEDGAMIQAVMDGILDTRNGGPAYIRISEVTEFAVYYVTVQGNGDNIVRVAKSLGFVGNTPGIIKL